MRETDWSATPLGAVETWPQSLRLALGICLGARTPIGIYWGEQLLLLYNDAFRQLIGDKHPQALGRPAREVFPEIWDTVGPMLAGVLATGVAVNAEGEHLPLLLGGRLEDRWFDFTANPIVDDDGQVEGILNIVVERTGRVHAERARLEGERRLTEVVRAAGLSSDFRALFEATPTPLLVLAPPDWTIVAANDARLQVTGTMREAVLGRKLFDVYPDDPNDPRADGVRNLGASLQRVLSTKAADVMAVQRYAVRDPSGRFVERWWSPMNTPVLGEDGEVALVIHRVEEVTDLVRLQGEAVASDQLARDQQAVIERLRIMEAALRESETRYRQIVEGAEDFAIVTLDERGLVQSWNSGARRITGFAEEEALGQPGGIFFTPEDRAAGVPEDEMSRARSDGRALDERWHQRKDNSRFWGSGLMMRMDQAGGGYLKIFRDRTAEHEAEATLRESEARFRLMADAAPQIVWITDRQGRMEFLNRKFTDYTGEPSREATPAEIAAEFMHPEDGAAVVAAFEAALARGAPFEVEHRIRSAAGEHRWFLARAEPYRDPETGEVVRWFGASVDIHDRREAEAELRESEAHLRAIVETATDYAIFTTDPEGRIETWSPGAQEVFGWTAEEAVGQLDELIFTPEDRARGLPDQERQAAQEAGQSPDVRWHLRRNGSRVFIEGMARPLTGPDGGVTGFVKVGQDVTERRATETALRESEARFRNMADHAPVMMWVTDAAGACTYLNRAWYEFTGQTPEEAEGLGWLEATHPDDKAEAERVFLDANAKAEPFRLEYRLRRHDGEHRWAIDAAAPRFGSKGEFLGYVGSVVDIHERKAAEAVLEQRVAEAVAERAVAEEQLRQSQKMEAMGSLTGGVAHDFNNLLTPIIGSLDRLVSRGVGSERERRLMAGALESAERAKVLVQRLLAFARRQPLQATAVNIGALVQNMAGLIGSTLGPTIEVRVDLAEDLPPARADAHQLEMALLNLAVNARDAMPEGGRLTVAAERVSVRGRHAAASGLKPGHYVRLAAADTGSGMDAATLARAVEPFFSTKGVGRGTGLGLSMVHGLAAQLGGGLTIQSRPGQGTTVELWLPLSAEPVDGAEVGQADVQPIASHGHALLVDDEDLVRMSTADMLSDLGFEVLEAGSAEEALRLLREGTAVDLLVTDHLMPGMSGAELAREARVLRPGLPVLIVSGYAEVDGIAPDLPRLVKPFRVAELAERVAALMPGGAPVG